MKKILQLHILEELRKLQYKINPKLVVVVITYALIIPLINSFDFEVFRKWIEAYLEGGLSGLYRASKIYGWTSRVVYPPLSPLLFIYSYIVSDSIADFIQELAISSSYANLLLLLEIPRLVFIAVLKTPVVAAVVAYAYTVKKLLGRGDLLVLLGPPTLIVIAAYDFDVFMMLFLLLSLYLLARSRYTASGILLVVSSLFKYVSILLLPFYLVVGYREGRWRSSTMVVVGVASASTITLLLLYLTGALEGFIESTLYHISRRPQGPVIYSLVGIDKLGVLSYIPLVSTAIVSALVGFRAPPRGEKIAYYMLACSLSLLVFIATSPVVNPVYTYWYYVLLAPPAAYILGDYRRAKKLVILNMLVVGSVVVWYIVPILYTAILNVPYFWEEYGVYVPASTIENYINSSIAGVYAPLGEIAENITKSSEFVEYVLLGFYSTSPLPEVLGVLVYTCSTVLLSMYIYRLATKSPR